MRMGFEGKVCAAIVVASRLANAIDATTQCERTMVTYVIHDGIIRQDAIAGGRLRFVLSWVSPPFY